MGGHQPAGDSQTPLEIAIQALRLPSFPGGPPLFQGETDLGITARIRDRVRLLDVPSTTLGTAYTHKGEEDLSLLLRKSTIPYPPVIQSWHKGSCNSDKPFLLSTRPEDRVFALLGMARDTHNLGIVPDYTKSVQDVYVVTARTIIQATHDLGILSFCPPHKNRVKRLPSWVPDWSVSVVAPPLDLYPRPSVTTTGQWHFLACSETQCQISHIDDTRITLSGVFVDIVDSTLRLQSLSIQSQVVKSRALNLEKAQDFVVSALDFISRSINTDSPRYTSQFFHDHAYDTRSDYMTSLDIKDGPHSFSRTYGLRAFEIFQNLITILNGPLEGTDRSKPEFTDYIDLLSRKSSDPLEKSAERRLHRWFSDPFHRHRRIFSIMRVFIGLGPDHAQKGDIVAIFHGGYVPFVLRPVPLSKDRRMGCYEIVGQAYMYGMMDGEFMWTSPKTREFDLV